MSPQSPKPPAWWREAQSLLNGQRLHEAQRLIEKVCNEQPEDPDAWAMLGAVHGRLGQYEQAETCYQRVTALRPDDHEAHASRGLALMYLERLALALQCFRVAVTIQPDYAQGHCHLACLLRDVGHYEEAIDAYQRALDIDPNFVEARVFLGDLLRAMGDRERARGCYNRVLQANPKHLRALAGVASLLEHEGRFAEAWEQLAVATDGDSIPPDMASIYARLAKRSGRATEAAACIERALVVPGLPPVQVEALHFALGDLYDAVGDYDRAFHHYHEGNVQRSHPFPMDHQGQRLEAMRQVFAPGEIDRLPAATVRSAVPVFIVGMPRSGTSLVEQILASHPQVFGAGELPDMQQLAQDAPKVIGSDQPYPFCLEGATPNDLDRLAGRYLHRLATMAPDAARVTNKMPTDFWHLGFIQQLFPNARVIHCVRHPLDTCLSCYFQIFSVAHNYSYDLTRLGRMYRLYREMMAHWRQVLTLPLLEVPYEEVVADQEGWSRTLVQFCGLEWDPQCLEFHRTRRYIHTASYDQVRRPIYSSSVRRWQHYAAHLAPLRDALGDVL